MRGRKTAKPGLYGFKPNGQAKRAAEGRAREIKAALGGRPSKNGLTPLARISIEKFGDYPGPAARKYLT
jgi:hypothetical protein